MVLFSVKVLESIMVHVGETVGSCDAAVHPGEDAADSVNAGHLTGQTDDEVVCK